MKHFYSISCLLFVQIAFIMAQSRDIIVGEKIVVQRCVVAGVSSRSIAVGHPSGVHYLFDAVNCTPRFAWSGDFIDFRGETDGRGGKGVKIIGSRQSLGLAKLPLRVGSMNQEVRSVEFDGYRRDPKTGKPTFRYRIDDQGVEQSIDTLEGNKVMILMTFDSKLEGVDKYYHLDPNQVSDIRLSEGLSWASSNVLKIPAAVDKAEITLSLKEPVSQFVRKEEKLTGAQIYQTMCSTCHSIDGHKLIGPSFKNLWSAPRVVIRDGREASIDADDSYVLESITHPQAAIVKGYEAVPMANFSKVLTKSQLESLLDYLKSLK